MISGLISGIFAGWFLTLFDFDEILIGFVKEVFSFSISTNTYYVIFALIGMLSELID